MTDPDKGVAYKVDHNGLPGLVCFCFIGAGGALGYLSHVLETPWLGQVAKVLALIGGIGTVVYTAVEALHFIGLLKRMGPFDKTRND